MSTRLKNIVVERDQSGNLLSIDMIRPSNFHAHLREGELMKAVCFDIMKWVKYLLVMPNNGPIDTIEKVAQYYHELAALSDTPDLEKVELVMTIYLTDKLTPEMVWELDRLPFKVEIKYYPPHRGATTGSGLGIPLDQVPHKTWETMAALNMPLLGHFESVYDKDGHELPMPEREAYFINNEYGRFRDMVPDDLMICIEHASTREAISIVKEDKSGNTVCTITPHHALISLDDLMIKSWANHGKCMPIPKGPEDVLTCREFMTSGDPRAILGDDTAPHPSSKKEGGFWSSDVACGCWWPHSLATYAYIFELEGALGERFVQFACLSGPDWRGLKRPDSSDQIRIVSETANDIPKPLYVPKIDDFIIPYGWTTDPDKLKTGLVHSIEHELTAS